MRHPDLLEGFDNFSDAGAFRLRDDLAIVQTVDFFPPIGDDPEDYGRIAAANSIGDLYAMGAKPLTALSIVGFPDGELDVSILGRILAAGAEKVLEAGALIVGGHSTRDKEIKFGLAMTGIVDPRDLIRNSGARAGDALVLTKALGTGPISTAGKLGKVDADVLRRAVASMATLNRDASELMRREGVHAATDITGFGFLGHAREMADASRVTLSIDAASLLVLPGAIELAAAKVLSGGANRNRSFLSGRVDVGARVPPDLVSVLYDSETSGGLLIALPPDGAPRLVEALRAKAHADAAVIGRVVPRGTCAVVLNADRT